MLGLGCQKGSQPGAIYPVTFIKDDRCWGLSLSPLRYKKMTVLLPNILIVLTQPVLGPNRYPLTFSCLYTIYIYTCTILCDNLQLNNRIWQ